MHVMLTLLSPAVFSWRLLHVEEARACKHYIQHTHGDADVVHNRVFNGALVLRLRHRLVRQSRLARHAM